MPGLILFQRRWAIAADDLVFPSILLVIGHVIWITVEILVFILIYQSDDDCHQLLQIHALGYAIMLFVAVIVEICVVWITKRGSIMNTSARKPVRPFLYIRCALFLLECGWMIFGIVCLAKCYDDYPEFFSKAALLGTIIFNAVVLLIVVIGVYFSYDLGGRKWLKLRRYEANIQSTGSKLHHGSGTPRTWRTSKTIFTKSLHCVYIPRPDQEERDFVIFENMCEIHGRTRLFTGMAVWLCFDLCSRLFFSTEENESEFVLHPEMKAVRAYQTSWNRRCELLFCCLSTGQRTSLAEIAQLLSDFFRDLDLVPSDIVAGLILLRRYQKLRRHALLAQNKSKTYKFLSGAPITQDTKFLNFAQPNILMEYKQLVRYMRFSLAVYGWPMYVCRGNPCSKLCGVVPGLRCVCCFWLPEKMPGLEVLDDNCCGCNSSAMWAVMESVAEDESIQFVHASYTGGVGVTPYFLALDHLQKKIVVTIRGTLSMKDIVTDLNADAEFIPVDPLQTNPPWLAHKGMVAAAEYVQKKLIREGKLKQLLELSRKKNGAEYDLLLVGHSLGGGTAAILAIMLKPEFPTLQCICFSPPGGLLNLPAAEYSRPFVTTCLLGKDMVARLGLHQLEAMRTDLLTVIQRSTCPKWKILLTSISRCMYPASRSDPALKRFADEQVAKLCQEKKIVSPYMTTHPPMYLPGRIIQIVRRYPSEKPRGRSLFCRKSQRRGTPVYHAIEADRESFYEVCLSPSMVDDHMPDTLLNAMERVLDDAVSKVTISKTSNGVTTTVSFDNLDSSASASSSDSCQISRTEQPSSASSAFASDLNVPYADMNTPTTPANSASPFSDRTPLYRPASSCSSRLTIPLETANSLHPPVRIYTSLVDQATSSYTLCSPDSDVTLLETVHADVHTAQPRLSLEPEDAVQRGRNNRVSKAKSLNEMPDGVHVGKRPKRHRSNERVVDQGRNEPVSASATGMNLQIPDQDGYRAPRKVHSQDTFVVSNKKGSQAQVRVGTLGSENDISPGTPVSNGSPLRTDDNFPVVSTEKTQYGTIYYV